LTTRIPWPTLAAIGIVTLVGVAQGLRSDHSVEVQAASERLGQVAPRAGQWAGQRRTLDPRELEAAEIGGCLLRQYVRPDGRNLTAMLVCGRPGPISVHTPDVCYAGAGFKLEGEAARFAVDLEDGSGAAKFWSATFVKPGVPLPIRYQILWSWSGSGAWSAENDPRLVFASLPVLCKLYVIRELPSNEPGGVDGSTVDFLRQFLPQVRETLFGGGIARP
jgi:hypothetical protein